MCYIYITYIYQYKIVRIKCYQCETVGCDTLVMKLYLLNCGMWHSCHKTLPVKRWDVALLS